MTLSRAVLVAGLVGSSGCVEFDYLLHAAEGQLDLACRARSVESSVDNDDLDPSTRALLADVPKMKAFAEQNGLQPTESYESFVALDRPSVVWTVSAAPPLSLEPKRWTFPIAGEVPYLGWFDKHLAIQQARWLESEGYDVDVRGAAAYSTLGWFSDPVLSSMIENAPDALAELANTILHESVHATVYIPGQSSFNEGLATYLGDELTVRFLDSRFGENSAELKEWQDGERRGKKVHKRCHEAFVELDALYKSDLEDAVKLEKKALVLADVRADVGFRRPVTNATLTNFSTYHSSRDDFARLYEACGRDIPRVMTATKTLVAEDFRERNQEDLSTVIELLSGRCANAATTESPRPESPSP